MIRDQCVKVDGALSVLFGREYAVKKLFFFCPKRLCINRPPVWSNTFITHPLAIIKGDDIPDEDHQRLMEDMESSYHLIDSDLISAWIRELLFLFIFTFL